MTRYHDQALRRLIKPFFPHYLLDIYYDLRVCLSNSKASFDIIRYFHKDIVNYLKFFISEGRDPFPGLAALLATISRSHIISDISDHLIPILTRSVIRKPQLIIELGVRGGESTFVLERAARLMEAVLVSVDLEDCSQVSTYWQWHFIRQDDLAFAEEFPRWCATLGIKPQIDILLIDSSHLFDHTRQEIRCYFPLLAEAATVFLHDTNLKETVVRRDGTTDLGWDNQRGVIKALEEYFGQRFLENQPFEAFHYPFLITHYPYCFGLTILEKRLT
jgi:hypothetical protein